MKKNKKEQILKIITEKLNLFDSSIGLNFICPTCLKIIDTKNLEIITEAHIIPKSALGNIFTLSCKKCNSSFGSKQDKWFGEYLNYLKEKNLLSDGVTQCKLRINGIPVTGKIQQQYDGIDVLIFKNKNSKYILNRIETLFLENTSINIEYSIPLIRKEKDILNGFVTAAYLFGFYSFGYSWVFQTYSNCIRKHILNINDSEMFHVAKTSIINDKPNIYIALIGHEPFLTFHIFNRLIFFPQVYNLDSISIVKKAASTDIKIIYLETISGLDYLSPIAISYGDKYLLYPGLEQINTQIKLIKISDDGNNEVTIYNLN